MQENNIQVEYIAEQVDEDTVLVTAAENQQWVEDRAAAILKSELQEYSTEPLMSVIPKDDSSNSTLSLEYISQLASGLNSSKENLLTANALIWQNVIADAFLGRTFESVVANINTDYRLTYGLRRIADDEADELAKVKDEVDYFNECVNLRQLIRDCITRTYAEGNCPLVLRIVDGKMPVIDMYPLSIAYPSDYKIGGRSVIEFDLKAVKAKLQKTYKKTKKRQAVYFENIDAEMKANYSPEIYNAYALGEDLVRLDYRYADCVKINDMGKKFGVSPLFRTLRPMIVLNQIEAADVSDSKARSKKIIFQKLRKEVMGPDGTRKGLDLALHAHQQAAQAIKTSFGLYTAIPAVESLEYVQAKTANEDAINQQKQYTKKLLTALGIGFTEVDATVGAVNISISQLMKTVNAIGENLETVLNKFYKTWVVDNGHDIKFAPTIRIIDSEQMEMSVRKELATFVYNILNCSRETALEIVGLDVDDEKQRRIYENSENYDEIFYPRQTAYTASDDDGPGRPKGELTEEQVYDETYNKTSR